MQVVVVSRAPCGRMRHLPLFLVLVAFVVSMPAGAATLVAIVSERNAADVAQAARVFHERFPQHRLVFRTTAQVDALSDAQLATLMRDADAILLATVFKETAQRVSAAAAGGPRGRSDCGCRRSDAWAA